MKYLVVVEETPTGFSAYSPDLPGCVATGATRQEVEQQISDAITFHIDGLHAEGVAPPPPRTFATYVDVPSS